MKSYIVGVCCLLVGSLLGYSINNDSFLDGRMSACKELVKGQNAVFVGLELSCKIYKGDVAIYTDLVPGVFWGLDGRKLD